MYKKYTIPLPSYGTWGSMDRPANEKKVKHTLLMDTNYIYAINTILIVQLGKRFWVIEMPWKRRSGDGSVGIVTASKTSG